MKYFDKRVLFSFFLAVFAGMIFALTGIYFYNFAQKTTIAEKEKILWKTTYYLSEKIVNTDDGVKVALSLQDAYVLSDELIYILYNTEGMRSDGRKTAWADDLPFDYNKYRLIKAQGSRWLVYDVYISYENVRMGTLRLAYSLGETDRFFASVFKKMLICSLFVMLVFAAAGYKGASSFYKSKDELLKYIRSIVKPDKKLVNSFQGAEAEVAEAVNDLTYSLRKGSEFNKLLNKKFIEGIIADGGKSVTGLIAAVNLIDANANKKERLDLTELLTGFAEKYFDKTEVRLSLSLQPSISINANKELVLLMFENLLTNVLVWANAANVEISSRKDINASGETLLTIEIQDDGDGICDDELDKVNTGDFGGSGLLISKKIAGLYAGKLFIESKKGFGTSVLIHFYGAVRPDINNS